MIGTLSLIMRSSSPDILVPRSIDPTRAINIKTTTIYLQRTTQMLALLAIIPLKVRSIKEKIRQPIKDTMRVKETSLSLISTWTGIQILKNNCKEVFAATWLLNHLTWIKKTMSWDQGLMMRSRKITVFWSMWIN